MAAASTSHSTEGQQAVGAIVANARDQRTLDWLRDRVGDDAIRDAIARIQGDRKPYLSNIAKVLGVALPSNLDKADKATALKHISELRERMAKKG